MTESKTILFMNRTLRSEHILQFIKYACVGVLNTLVTLGIIYLCKSILEVNMWVSNAIGYVAGMLNSFVWNKLWVFNSRGKKVIGEMLKFFTGFGVCYLLQLLVTWLLTFFIGSFEMSFFGFVISGYGVATLFGMVFYTMANYVYNKAITFK